MVAGDRNEGMWTIARYIFAANPINTPIMPTELALSLLLASYQMLQRYVDQLREIEREATYNLDFSAASSLSALLDQPRTVVPPHMPVAVDAPGDPLEFEYPRLGGLSQLVKILTFPDPDNPCEELISTGRCPNGDSCPHLHTGTSIFQLVDRNEGCSA